MMPTFVKRELGTIVYNPLSKGTIPPVERVDEALALSEGKPKQGKQVPRTPARSIKFDSKLFPLYGRLVRECVSRTRVTGFNAHIRNPFCHDPIIDQLLPSGAQLG